MPRRLELRTDGPDATRELGHALAGVVRPGDVLALTGELGAGKTCLVQGIAHGLGIADRITSPTFVLLKVYREGRIPLAHGDVYRLERLQDVAGLGDEILGPDVVTVIEWGDMIRATLPEDLLEVELVMDPDVDDLRHVCLHPAGRWVGRLDAVARVCERWRVDGASC